MDINKNIAAVLAHSMVYFSRQEWKFCEHAVCSGAPTAGYDIPISIASTEATQSDPLFDPVTNFIFGNGDSPTSSPVNAPIQSAPATATTTQGGTSAANTPGLPIGSVAGVGTAATSSSSSSSIWLIVLLAGAAIFLIHHFSKK